MKNYNLIFINIFLITIVLLFQSCASDQASAPLQSNGKAGSMARFAVKGDYLYTIDNQTLNIFDISKADEPIYKNQKDLGWGIETIYPYDNYIFIGTQTGMQILDNTNPVNPNWVSTYAHVRSCDPVVVQGKYAYVTLRSGTQCMGFTNQLEVIDISNVSQPQILKTYPMYNPHGLGIDNQFLFVCDGTQGLRFFDAQDPVNLVESNHLTGKDAFDVIPHNGLLMMIGKDGLYQYDYYGNLLSSIAIVQ